ncbi:MAG: YhgN family NAAT transporter [Myxococcales bacterium]|nr:YhgN family NAAT transporter [Myxococcales bacterium]MCB9648459.1 YhgN family NAAT transporter [Deltaproteobacteria bacterium]
MQPILSAAVLLFMVMDPLGNVPIFLSVLERVPPDRRQAVLRRELLVALAVLVVFALFGARVLDVLGLREESVSVAGGIIVFLIALRMMFPTGPATADDLDGEPFVVPLAIPLVAGPSAFATLLLLAGHEEGLGTPALLVALLVAWAVSAAILMASGFLRRVLGRRGLIAVERLMGMLLVAVAVQMFLDGVKRYLA